MPVSAIYAVVRLRIKHPEDTTPETVLQECDYSFTPSQTSTPGAEVVDTEIVDITKHYPYE